MVSTTKQQIEPKPKYKTGKCNLSHHKKSFSIIAETSYKRRQVIQRLDLPTEVAGAKADAAPMIEARIASFMLFINYYID